MGFIQEIIRLFLKFVDLFLHLDKYLGSVIQSCGNWTYLILFLIIFCETGLVVTPLLPGDSLLFAIGIFAARGDLDLYKIWPLLAFAAILGDNVNYAVGNYIGPKVFHYENSKIFKKEYLQKTHDFYEKYGGKTIILAKYVPIVRTFAPFVAGVGAMTYPKFLMFNVIGAFTWVTVIMMTGYFFGNLPVIKNNFSFVILAIIILSVLPGVIEYIRRRKRGAP
ncbi:MAG: DedA family protein [Elusimicrobia bacterium]|nr:DedA family protein [Elusimicrobiota bacterium]